MPDLICYLGDRPHGIGSELPVDFAVSLSDRVERLTGMHCLDRLHGRRSLRRNAALRVAALGFDLVREF